MERLVAPMKRNDAGSLWSRVDQSGGPEACWPFTGPVSHNGYGRLPLANGTVRAHRLAFELTHGPIPAGMRICHRCDNPPCCNPSHLFQGTDTDNVADAAAKGRRAIGERHPQSRLTVEAVRAIRSSSEPPHSLARRFGVSRKTIYRVLRREFWAHVP